MKKNKLIKFFFTTLFFIILINNFSHSSVNFNSFANKQTSYLDFLLLKLENKLINRVGILRSQMLPSRVQYSHVGIEINYDKKNEKIFIEVQAIMDKHRYTKKKYKQKLSDCNVVRNLIFYQKIGYKFFTQKRDLYLSEELMEKIFKESFLSNLTLDDNEIKFLLKNMLVKVNVIHPVNKTNLVCSGNVNDFELQ